MSLVAKIFIVTLNHQISSTDLPTQVFFSLSIVIEYNNTLDKATTSYSLILQGLCQ